jgi:hypothetical protein
VVDREAPIRRHGSLELPASGGCGAAVAVTEEHERIVAFLSRLGASSPC